MMNPIYGHLYTRPGNLIKDFDVYRLVTENRMGYRTDHYEKMENGVRGIISVSNEAADRHTHRWDQDQHSLTHILIIRGTADIVKEDVLVCDGVTFLVLSTDDESMIGASGMIYLEERNDLNVTG